MDLEAWRRVVEIPLFGRDFSGGKNGKGEKDFAREGRRGRSEKRTLKSLQREVSLAGGTGPE